MLVGRRYAARGGIGRCTSGSRGCSPRRGLRCVRVRCARRSGSLSTHHATDRRPPTLAHLAGSRALGGRVGRGYLVISRTPDTAARDAEDHGTAAHDRIETRNAPTAARIRPTNRSPPGNWAVQTRGTRCATTSSRYCTDAGGAASTRQDPARRARVDLGDDPGTAAKSFVVVQDGRVVGDEAVERSGPLQPTDRSPPTRAEPRLTSRSHEAWAEHIARAALPAPAPSVRSAPGPERLARSRPRRAELRY
jgi:hypothetical protein